METEQRSEEMKVKDPRTEEESAHASDLLNLVLVCAHKHTQTQVIVLQKNVIAIVFPQ